DNNGYVDDIHGYNFLGESYNEQLEMARILALKLGDAKQQERAKAKLDEDYQKALQNKERNEQIYQAVKNADLEMKKYLGKDSYTKNDLTAIKTEDQTMIGNIGSLTQMFSIMDTIPEVLAELNDGITHFSEKLNYNLNVDFNGRKIVGDDP